MSNDYENPEVFREKEQPVWDPENGPLFTRVKGSLVEEQVSDEINVIETAYWFHTPPGGWWGLGEFWGRLFSIAQVRCMPAVWLCNLTAAGRWNDDAACSNPTTRPLPLPQPTLLTPKQAAGGPPRSSGSSPRRRATSPRRSTRTRPGRTATL
jgi:hypothetical protein